MGNLRRVESGSDSGVGSTLLGVAASITKFSFLFSAWVCVAVFMAWQQVSIIGTWSWYYDDSEAPWEKLRTKMDLKYNIEEGQSLLYGWDNLNIVWNFMTVLGAAVAVTIAVSIPYTRVWGALSDFADWLWRPIKRTLNWQMPFQRFWLNWCSGLTFAEGILWGGWVVVHAVGLWDLMHYLADDKFKAWRDMGMRMHAPRSVLVLEDISVAIAWILYIDLAVMFLPISHNSFLNRMFGIPYAGLIRFHRWVSHFALWCVAGHGLFYYFLWIADPTINFWKAFFDWKDMYHIPSFAGTIAFAFGIMIWVTSFDWVRRNYFKVFYRCHIIGFTLFTIFSFVHYYWSWFGFFPGLFLYAADVVVRSYYSAKGAHITALKRSKDGTTMHVDVTLAPKTFKDPLSLRGAHIFLRIPALSRLDWHPFTVADVVVDAAGYVNLCLVVKSYADWTKRLSELGASLEAPNMGAHTPSALRVNIWRPFDTLSDHMDWRKYDDLLLLAGGIAVTPAAALLRTIIGDLQAGRASAPPRRARLVFIARNAEEFAALGADLMQATRHHDWLEISLHYTGKDGAVVKSTSMAEGKQLPTAAVVPIVDKVSAERSHSGSGSDEYNAQHGGVALPGSPSSSSVSSKFWNALWRIRLLPLDFMSDAQFIWVVLLAFFGGFMGIIISQAAYIQLYSLENYVGTWTGMVGLISILVIGVDCVGFPALFIVMPIQIKRLYNWCRGVQQPAPAMRAYSASAAPIVDSFGKVSCPESGVSLDIQPGRPDLAALVRDFAEAAHAAGAMAAVVSAGPRPMMHAVTLAIGEVNGAGGCCSKAAPYLDKYDFAFEF